MTPTRVLGVIPARLGALRLPDKPLRLLGGVPLVVRVALNAEASGAITTLVVATDAEPVMAAVRAAGFKAVMTSADHPSGTSRVAEVAASAPYRGYDVIVNIQGDEPFLPAAAIQDSIALVRGGADIGTAAVPLDPDEAPSPNVVKVVVDESGRALYFSRSPIPYARDGGPVAYWQHLGIYAFAPAALQTMVALPPTALERAEVLEQLRALGHGMTIGVARLIDAVPPGIDTAEDLARAELFLARRESHS